MEATAISRGLAEGVEVGVDAHRILNLRVTLAAAFPSDDHVFGHWRVTEGNESGADVSRQDSAGEDGEVDWSHAILAGTTLPQKQIDWDYGRLCVLASEPVPPPPSLNELMNMLRRKRVVASQVITGEEDGSSLSQYYIALTATPPEAYLFRHVANETSEGTTTYYILDVWRPQTEEELATELRKMGAPLGEWGTRGTKELKCLMGEISAGESTIGVLKGSEPGQIQLFRMLSVVNVLVRRQEWERHIVYEDRVLMEVYDINSEDRFRRRMSPPSRHMKIADAGDRAVVAAAAATCLREELRVDLGMKKASECAVQEIVYSDWMPSPSYPGLPSCYMVHPVRITIPRLPSQLFRTTDNKGRAKVPGYHFWHWVPSSAMKRGVLHKTGVEDKAAQTPQPFLSLGGWATAERRRLAQDGAREGGRRMTNIDSDIEILEAICDEFNWKNIRVKTLTGAKPGSRVLQVKGTDIFLRSIQPCVAKFGPVKAVVDEYWKHQEMSKVLNTEHVPRIIGNVLLSPDQTRAGFLIEICGIRWFSPELCSICNFIQLRDMYLGEHASKRSSKPFLPQQFQSTVNVHHVMESLYGSILYPKNHKVLKGVDITSCSLTGDYSDGAPDATRKNPAPKSLRWALDVYTSTEPEDDSRHCACPEVIDYFLSPEGQDITERIDAFKRWLNPTDAEEAESDIVTRLFTRDFHISTQHGDLHGSNVLVDSQDEIWLIDFQASVTGGLMFNDLAKMETSILMEYAALHIRDDQENREISGLRYLVDKLYWFKATIAEDMYTAGTGPVTAQSLLPWGGIQLNHRPSTAVDLAESTVLCLRKWLGIYVNDVAGADRSAQLSCAVQFYTIMMYHLLKLLGKDSVSPAGKKLALHAIVRIGETLREIGAFLKQGKRIESAANELAPIRHLPEDMEADYVMGLFRSHCSIADVTTGQKLDLLEQCCSVECVEAGDVRRKVASASDLMRITSKAHLKSFGASCPVYSAVRWVLEWPESSDSNLFVVGLPASGKTILLKQLLLIASLGGSDYQPASTKPVPPGVIDLGGLPSDGEGVYAAPSSGRLSPNDKRKARVPVLIPLADLARAVGSYMERLSDREILEQYWMKEYGSRSSMFKYLKDACIRGRLLILLDGLDEVKPSSGMRIIKMMEEMASNGHRLVVSTRPTSWDLLQRCVKGTTGWKWDLAVIQPLSTSMQKRMANNILRGDADRFMGAVAKTKDYKELTSTPLLLSLLMDVYRKHKYLPTNRGRLYDGALKSLTYNLDCQRAARSYSVAPGHEGIFSSDNFSLFLENLAFHLHITRGRGTRDFSAALAEKFAATQVDIRGSTTWRRLRRLIDDGRVPLLANVGTDKKARSCYRFVHLTFQEYLAARKIQREIETEIKKLNVDKFLLNKPIKTWFKDSIFWTDSKDVMITINQCSSVVLHALQTSFGGATMPIVEKDQGWTEQLVRLLGSSVSEGVLAMLVCALQKRIDSSRPKPTKAAHKMLGWVMSETGAMPFFWLLGKMQGPLVQEWKYFRHSITELNLEQASLKLKDIEELTDALMTNSTCKSLDLRRNNLCDRCAEYISDSLLYNKTLQTLILAYNNIGDAGLVSLTTSIKRNKSLRSLVLDGNPIGTKGINALEEALLNNKVTHKVSLNYVTLNTASMTSLARALRNNMYLTELDLKGSTVSDRGVEVLGEALTINTSLQTLHLGCNAITDRGVKSLGEALELNIGLQHLSLKENVLTHQSVTSIGAALKTNKTLTTLDLTGNCFGDDGAVAVGNGIVGSSPLRSLWMNDCGVGMYGATAIGRSLEASTTLQELHLGAGNFIGDEGVLKLAKALRVNNSLRTLNIEKNGITDSGATAVAEALQVNTTLGKLYMTAAPGEVEPGLLDETMDSLLHPTIGVQDESSISSKGALLIAQAVEKNKTLTTLVLRDPRDGVTGATSPRRPHSPERGADPSTAGQTTTTMWKRSACFQHANALGSWHRYTAHSTKDGPKAAGMSSSLVKKHRKISEPVPLLPAVHTRNRGISNVFYATATGAK